MNILFIYSVRQAISPQKPLTGNDQIQFGISYISALLRQHGHNTRLVIADRAFGKTNHKLIADAVSSFKPDIIGFSSVFSEFDFISSLAIWVKKQYPNIFTILGGVHVTLNPSEKFLETFDAICIGEGEHAMVELALMMQNGQKPAGIKNLWIKSDNYIEKNTPRPFANLDLLPHPDRQIWENYIVFRNSAPVIMLGRGCPFNCTYCSNHTLRNIQHGNYVRFRNPKDIADEVRELSNLQHNEFYFEVETLGVDMIWLEALCNKLSLLNEEKNSTLKFGSNLRLTPNTDADKIFSLLKMAGFNSISIGLESGSEIIRTKILNRRYSNQQVIDACRIARSKGISVGLYNLIGIPGETYDDFCQTLALNQLIQPDWHATSVYFPYPGTSLFDRAVEMNLLSNTDLNKKERQFAVLDLPGFPKKLIQKSFDRFHFDVYKKNKKPKLSKLFIYYIQIFIGHYQLSQLKTSLIRLLLKAGLIKTGSRLKLFTIFQKT